MLHPPTDFGGIAVIEIDYRLFPRVDYGGEYYLYLFSGVCGRCLFVQSVLWCEEGYRVEGLWVVAFGVGVVD